jgi:hypothetical protein
MPCWQQCLASQQCHRGTMTINTAVANFAVQTPVGHWRHCSASLTPWKVGCLAASLVWATQNTQQNSMQIDKSLRPPHQHPASGSGSPAAETQTESILSQCGTRCWMNARPTGSNNTLETRCINVSAIGAEPLESFVRPTSRQVGLTLLPKLLPPLMPCSATQSERHAESACQAGTTGASPLATAEWGFSGSNKPSLGGTDTITRTHTVTSPLHIG